MPVHRRISKKEINLESIDDLFDAGYLQFTIGDDGLNLEMTEAGFKIFLDANKERVILETKVHDPAFIKFRKLFYRYLGFTGILIILICFFIIQYKKG